MKFERDTCNNLGGLNRIWIANQADGEANIVSDENGITEVILSIERFTEIEFESGGLAETMELGNAGESFSTGINLAVRKNRPELLAFEQMFKGKRLMALCHTNNLDWRIVRNLSLSREAQTGANPPAYNVVNYTLSGNSIENATFGIVKQDAYWLQTRFIPEAGRNFNPSITFSSLGEWRFENLNRIAGNNISVDGIEQGLDGSLQTVAFQSEDSSNGITELFFRDNAIAGIARLDLLPNLTTADLAINQIEEVKVGAWANKPNVVIELRENRIGTDKQEQFLQALYSNITGANNLKISLLNQNDGEGNDYMPNEATIDLAVLLYEQYQVEIYLSESQTELRYSI